MRRRCLVSIVTTCAFGYPLRVHIVGFIPELFHRWKNTQANHVVTIILFSRVFYNDAEIQLLKAMDSSGRYVSALQTDPYLGHYKDFYKVIVDFETRQEWLSIMPELKKQMIETHEEILLNYHTGENEAAKVEILGRLSYVGLIRATSTISS